MQGQTATELRGFTTGNLYSGGAGVMPGGNTAFLAAALIRVLGPTSTAEVIWSNRGASNNGGWAIHRLADSASNINLACSIYNASTNITVDIDISRSDAFGRLYLVVLEYVPDDTDGVVNAYVNGGFVATDTATQVATASSGTPDLGGGNNVAPCIHTSVLAAAYTTDFTGTTGPLVAASWLESIKRCEIVSVTNLDWEYSYSAERNSGFASAAGTGYPRTVTNNGSVGIAGDLQKVGSTALVVGTPAVLWGCGAGPDGG